MKEKIAFPQLVELVASKASTTTRMSELFLQELFATVEQALCAGESVKIKGLGTFKTVKEDGERQVVFSPDSELAKDVNAPFEHFKPVELSDDITAEQLAEIDNSMEPKPAVKATDDTQKNQTTAVAEPPVAEAQNTQDPIQEVASAQEAVNNEDCQSQPQKTLQEQAAKQEISQAAEATDSVAGNTIATARNFKFKPWMAVAAAALAVVVIAGSVVMNRNHSANKEKQVAKISAIMPKPVPKVVTDTLTGNNGIVLMAQKHYGDQAFWVYIARENQDKYPDYHEMPSGAVIVIPPAEKYGINSDSKQSLRTAYEEAVKLKAELESSKTDSNEHSHDRNDKEDEDHNGHHHHKSSIKLQHSHHH